MMRMIRTQISLTEEQMDGLRLLAREQNRSIAAVLRDAVDIVLKSDSVRDRALLAIGAHESGHEDVSVRHDAHLEDAFRQ